MTQPIPKKAREFWIEQFNGRKPPSFYAFKDKPNFNKLMLKIDDAEVKACEYFHVIEISAVTRLQAQLAAAKEALEFYADPKTYESKREREIKIGDYFAWECSFPIKEDHDGDTARAALAKINSLDGVE